MVSSWTLLVAMLARFVPSDAAFVHPSTATVVSSRCTNIGWVSPNEESSSRLALSPLESLDWASSMWLATIDADIDSIPTNEFGTVFAGGIVVMFGGLLSALIVGFILENNNSYADVVADSYAQGGDEAFWEQLSEEEQKKAREMINRMKKAKGEEIEDEEKAPLEKTPSATPPVATTTEEAPTKKTDMFSDYD